LDITGVKVIPRYISTLVKSPCFDFNKGFITPKRKSSGTHECRKRALNNCEMSQFLKATIENKTSVKHILGN